MKPEKNIIPAAKYYYEHWRKHSIRVIVSLIILSNAIVWAIVAAFYGMADTTIWLCCLAAFLTVFSVVEYRSTSYYYGRFQRALPDTNPNDANL